MDRMEHEAFNSINDRLGQLEKRARWHERLILGHAVAISLCAIAGAGLCVVWWRHAS